MKEEFVLQARISFDVDDHRNILYDIYEEYPTDAEIKKAVAHFKNKSFNIQEKDGKIEPVFLYVHVQKIYR